MTKEKLQTEIETRFPSRRAFVEAFNAKIGKVIVQGSEVEPLDETVVSNQISGNRGISKLGQAAYILFFQLTESDH